MDLLQGLGDKKREHRARKSGAKKDKKVAADKKKRGLSTTDRKNPRAFSVSHVVSAKKQQQRNLDMAQKKEVVPLVSRAEDNPPPVMVVVMGPAGVGKSLLIRSLVKIYTGQNLADTKGPITVVAGKNRRITFFECPSDDIYAMTDLAKVADLVLLMIDASYGFEMETFEFLNLLQLHGFPKVMGVLTHLDSFKANKTLQKTKKALKQRFWTEIYKGAKMFEFSGVVYGKYLKHEVKKLSLHVSRVKFRPLIWRNSHPFVVADRIEDITSPHLVDADPKCNRDVSLYGYVRGTHLKPSMRVHLIGGGDFDIEGITAIDDPCPLGAVSDARASRKSLKSKDTLLYAPLANVGRVQMDKDGVYIDIKDVHYTKNEQLHIGQAVQEGRTDIYAGTPAGLLRSLQDVGEGMDRKMEGVELSLFRGSAAVVSSEHRARVARDDAEDGSDEEGDEEGSVDEEEEEDGDEEEDEEEEEYEGEVGYDDDAGEEATEGEPASPEGGDTFAWKTDMKERATSRFLQRKERVEAGDLMEQIYGADWKNAGLKVRGADIDDGSDEESDGEELFKPKSSSLQRKYEEMNRVDSNRFKGDASQIASWKAEFKDLQARRASGASNSVSNASEGDSYDEAGEGSDDEDEEGGGMEYDESDGESEGDAEVELDDVHSEVTFLTALKNKFVTGDWGGKKLGAGGEEEGSVQGDFEDMETGERHGEDSEEEEEKANLQIDEELRASNAKKKAAAKLSFDADYDSKKEGAASVKGEEEEEEKVLEVMKKRQEEQRSKNQAEFGDDGELIRLQHEGIRQGIYVRIVIREVPVEFMENFDPRVPVVLGGLLPQEMSMGLIRCRVKRHRWHKRILKTNDPLIFSVGWRRYQSMPVYSMEDINQRERLLKYTPEHMHCNCTFYGPLVPPNTGILAYQRASKTSAGFRISMTGTTLELQVTGTVVKKLKLVGTPMKIFKNTAFVSGMFNTALEVAKFEGAKLKTVSGIRGQIKKALKEGGGGAFRASFEDKILMSDLVVCRLWVPVEIKNFYNPVLSLLSSTRAEDGSVLSKADSWQGMRTVAQIRKDEKIPIPLNKDSLYKPIVRVQREFSKLVVPKKIEAKLPFASKSKDIRPLNKDTYMAKRAVILEPEDRKKRAVVDMLSTIRAEKTTKRKAKQSEKHVALVKRKAAETEKFKPMVQEERKRKFTEKGKEESRRAAKRQRNSS